MIDIIIINYNCKNHLQNLLTLLTQSILKSRSRHARYAITVVDNHSLDGSQEMVRSEFPQVNLLAQAQNRGYSAAVNAGIIATENPDILLLNADIRIMAEGVAGLSRIWERLGCHSIIGPLHRELDGFPQLTWGEYPVWRAEARRRRLEKSLRKRKTWAREKLMAECCRTREVDWISGSCMYFSRAIVNEIGLWDEKFFLYFEDIDWCLRARQKGIAIYHTAEVTVTHIHGASVSADFAASEREYRRSQCYFTEKYFSSFALFRLRSYLTLKMLLRCFMGGPNGLPRRASWRMIGMIWKKQSG